jgi:hypothetical protein
VIRVAPARRGRRRISYKTRGRRRQAKAILVRTQRRGKRRVRITRIRGRGVHRFALENPLTGGELVIIGITGVVGATAGNLVDRLLATHALNTASGQGGATDSPDATKDQVYNFQAVAAPMDWKRWAAGIGGAAVPLAIGAYVKSPGWRSTWQGLGIGWGLNTLITGATNLMTMIFGKSAFGQRVYANEISAANAAKNAKAQGASALPAVPVIGLAAPAPTAPAPQTAPCAKCTRQVAVGMGCPCQSQGARPGAVTAQPAPALPAPAPGLAAAPSQRPAVAVSAPSWRSRRPVEAAYRA